jgi:glycosyltransferase involved in cell wall biosynthesis
LDIDVIIPALNESEAIGLVLSEIPKWVRKVVVVDNGSTDNTSVIAGSAGAVVVKETRHGYGYACLAGIQQLSQGKEPAIVVFLDGDYSDFPAEMGCLIAPIQAGTADMVIGSRLRGHMQRGAMLWHAYLGNRLLSALFTYLSGVKVTDIGPFRAMRWDCLKNLTLQESRYGWTLEMMLKAVHCGARLIEVPVSYRPRLGKSKVSGSPVASLKAAWVMLFTLVRYSC